MKKWNEIFSLILKPGLLLKDYSRSEIRVFVSLFTLHMLAVGLSLIVNLTAIRLTGVDLYGEYIYLFNILFILAGFCAFGADTLLIKTISGYLESEQYPLLKGIIQYAIRLALLFSILAGFFIVSVAGHSRHLKNLSAGESVMLFFLILPLISIGVIFQAALQGMKRPVYSQLTEKLFRPGLLLLIFTSLIILGVKLNLFKLITIHMMVVAVTALASYFLLKNVLGLSFKKVKPIFEYRVWLKVSVSFLLLDVLYVLFARLDIFILGIYRTNSEIGFYNIVSKISDLCAFSLMMVNFVLAPVIAGLIANKERFELQKLITRSARIVLLISLPVFIFLIIFRTWILAIFRIHSPEAEKALVILCGGQFVSIFCGSVGLLLVMSGNQVEAIKSIVLAIVVGILLNLILVPIYGIIGTATSSAISLVVWNLLMYIFVRRKLFLHTTIFGSI